jgi:dipeptidyl aminopeptidase/acylaminoacyl peptidase
MLIAAIAGTLWRLRGPALPPPSVAQLSSERWAGAGSFSPDGTQVAYASAGEDGANWDIWVKIVGQVEARRITTDPAVEDFPAWSPDGAQIAFDSVARDGNRDVWTIGVDGSGLRRITQDPAHDIVPSWSHDGRVIYFASSRTGRFEVWRTSADGGAEVQITVQGGRFPLESMNGRTLYYLAGQADGPLMSRPTAGGEERTVLPCVRAFGYAVAPRGIVYHECLTAETAGTPRRPFRYWDTATGQDREIASVTADVIGNLSVAPDGGSIAYGGGLLTSDLMMIESFR